MGLPLLVADLALFGACLAYELFLEKELEKFRLVLPNGVEVTGKDMMATICRTYDLIGQLTLTKGVALAGVRVVIVSSGSLKKVSLETLRNVLTALKAYAEKVLPIEERAILSAVVRRGISKSAYIESPRTKRELIEEFVEPLADSTEVSGQLETLLVKPKELEFYGLGYLEVFGIENINISSEAIEKIAKAIDSRIADLKKKVKKSEIPEVESIITYLKELRENIISTRGFGLAFTAISTGERGLASILAYSKHVLNALGDVQPFVISGFRDVLPHVLTPQYFSKFYQVSENIVREAQLGLSKSMRFVHREAGGVLFGDALFFIPEKERAIFASSAFDYMLEFFGAKPKIVEQIGKGNLIVRVRAIMDEKRIPSETWSFLEDIDFAPRLDIKRLQGFKKAYSRIVASYKEKTIDFKVGKWWRHPALLLVPPVAFHLFSGVGEDSMYWPKECKIPFGVAQEELIGGEGEVG